MFRIETARSDTEIASYIQAYKQFNGLELDVDVLKDRDSLIHTIRDTKTDCIVAGVSAHFNDAKFRFLEYLPTMEEDPNSEALWAFLEENRGRIVEGGGGFINRSSGLLPHLLLMIMMSYLAFKFYITRGKKYSVICTNHKKIKQSATILCRNELYEGRESVRSTDKPGHYLAVLSANNAAVPFLLFRKLLNVSVRAIRRGLERRRFTRVSKGRGPEEGAA